MKIIVTTCDSYMDVLKGFAYMFNKYWSSKADVTILGYTPPTFYLPDNFEFISLGKQRDYGREWTTALIPFFKQLSDEYFILLLDDMYIQNMDESLLHKAEEHMAKGADKIFLVNLSGCVGISEREKDVNFNVVKQNFKFRASLQPSFIRRDYFLKYLRPEESVWQYELDFEAAKNDDAQILVPKQNIVSFVNLVLKGSGRLSKIGKEDSDAIRQLGDSGW